MTALSKLQLKQLWKAYFQPTSANFSDLIDSWADYNYTATGTSAVARPVISKLGDIVSVKDFGAVGDGVTDDTAAINACVNYAVASGGATVRFPSGGYKITSTLVLKSKVSLDFEGGAKIIWAGAASGTCVETISTDVVRDVVWSKLHVDTGASFSGTAVRIRSGQSITADVICLTMTGTTSTGLWLSADSSAGGDSNSKRNLTALRIGQLVQLGVCGTCLYTSGVTDGHGPADPQVVTLNTIGQILATDCRQYGVHFYNWTDSNNFPGMNRFGLYANNAVGLQIGGTNAILNQGVYNNHFGTVAPDCFDVYTGRIGVRLQRTKLIRINALYANPKPEGGRFVTDGSVFSYDVMEMLDDISATYPNNMIHHQRGVSAHPSNGGAGISTERVTLLDDTATSFDLDNPVDAGTNIVCLVAVCNSASPNGNGVVRVKVRRAAGAVESSIVAGDAFLAVTTGALTGTTGTDVRLNVSPHTDGKLYIENRLGSTVSISLSFLARIQI